MEVMIAVSAGLALWLGCGLLAAGMDGYDWYQKFGNLRLSDSWFLLSFGPFGLVVMWFAVEHRGLMFREPRAHTSTPTKRTEADVISELAEEPVVIHGWREYQMDARGFLYGKHDQRWETRHESAHCINDRDRCARHISTPPAGGLWRDSGDPREILSASRCLCGIHAYRSRDRFRHSSEVVAQVVMWGVVAEHEDGYRASECRIDRLFIPDGSDAEYAKELLERRYPEVPVEIESRAVMREYAVSSTGNWVGSTYVMNTTDFRTGGTS